MRPASLVVPKALLPVGTWPMLHWTLDEVVAAGVPAIAIVSGPEQELVRRYVEHLLAAAGEPDDAGRLGASLAEREIRFVEQPTPAGIGDALLRCRPVTGDEAFAVLLPDNWFDCPRPAIAQVAETYASTGSCCFGLTRIRAQDAALFGNVGGVELEPLQGRSHRVLALQDKRPGSFVVPSGGSALRGCARYVLDGRFYEGREANRAPEEGEWDDVPAFQSLAARGELAAHRIDGRHFDVGHPEGYLAAAAYQGRRRSD